MSELNETPTASPRQNVLKRRDFRAGLPHLDSLRTTSRLKFASLSASLSLPLGRSARALRAGRPLIYRWRSGVLSRSCLYGCVSSRSFFALQNQDGRYRRLVQAHIEVP